MQLNNENVELTDLTITLELDDGQELECDVILKFPIDEMQYICLAPIDDDSFENIYIYRFEEVDGEPVLTCIESDEEYEIVADRFDEILDELEYQEAMGDEEE